MEITGKIILDLPMQSGTSRAGNAWRKKEWVLETMDQYPKKVMFYAFGDRIDSLHLELGKIYTVSFDVESREFNGRWYTDVRAYAARPAESVIPGSNDSEMNIDPFGPAPQSVSQPLGGNPYPQQPAAPFVSEGDATEDLPF